MDFISNNIKFLRKQKGFTQQSFADELGVKRSLIGAYEEGRAKPNIQVQLAITKMFGISLEQLLTEDLNAFAEKSFFEKRAEKFPTKQTSSIDGDGHRILTITVDSENKENIELVAEKAAAGYLNGYADPEYIEELPKFQLPFLSGGTYRAFEIKGDSMLPLQPGSIVIGEYSESLKDIKDGQTYVMLTKQDGIVYKRVFNKVEEGGHLILRSDNPSYPPYNVHAEDVMELWKAKLFISKATPDNDLSLEKLMSMMLDLQQEVLRLKGAEGKKN